jgi:hypothetical protein
MKDTLCKLINSRSTDRRYIWYLRSSATHEMPWFITRNSEVDWATAGRLISLRTPENVEARRSHDDDSATRRPQDGYSALVAASAPPRTPTDVDPEERGDVISTSETPSDRG